MIYLQIIKRFYSTPTGVNNFINKTTIKKNIKPLYNNNSYIYMYNALKYRIKKNIKPKKEESI